MREDDWSFVIKLHALFESALGYVVGQRLGPEVAAVVMRPDMNGSKGKVAFARALGVINDGEVRYLDLLSKLRNRCAHGVRQAVEFSLPGYLANVSPNERKQFVHALHGDQTDRPVALAGRTTTAAKFALDNPKIEIWLIAMWMLASLYLLKELEDLVRAKERMLIEASLRRQQPVLNGLFAALRGSPSAAAQLATELLGTSPSACRHSVASPAHVRA
ncbi:hypothetical protein [Paraburkholderia antibiotica]|uniref:Uncharacterized protein n=1 Tax=Paraburkholderia antibiotica TaxID=2728839 RepID=A0A7X9X356_9BURK|nr:hypothetical protein [Paraburkholderia antibiotica]NML30584.1 hypothetical protein [Paraburkholderia antibiotica]